MQHSSGSSTTATPKPPAIRPLPEEVVAQIKSSTTILSLEDVVIGLLKNALDAEAGRIDVSVDFGRGNCTVEDDGWGISPAEFLENGGLGRIYHTSKVDSPSSIHGGDGTFIASLAATSILTITSHHHAHRLLATLLYHHTRPAARLVPAPSHCQLSHREHGTRVEVHDLFGNMPVRVKQRGLVSTNKQECTREWDSLRKTLVGLLLAWHKPVDVVLKDYEGHRKVFVKNKQEDSNGSKVTHQASSSLDVSWICHLLSQAAYIEPGSWNSWIKASARTPYVTIRGTFSLQPVETKRIQFISLGIRYLPADTGASVLYDAVNRVFALSSFGNVEDSLDKIVDEGLRSKDRRFKKGGHTNKQLRGAGKGIDRWPAFVIRIELQGQMSKQFRYARDIVEQESTLSSIVKALVAMTTSFLSDHHFRPRASRKRRRLAIKSKPSSGSNGRDLPQSAVEIAESPSTSEPGSEGTKTVMGGMNGSRQSAFNQDLLSSTIRIPNFHVDQNRYIDEGFRSWSRIKIGRTRKSDDGFCTSSHPLKHVEEGHRVSSGCLDPENSSTRKKNDTSASPILVQIANSESSSATDVCEGEDEISKFEAMGRTPNLAEDTFSWVHPMTKDTILINARTGFAVTESQRPRSAVARNTSLADSELPSANGRVNSSKLACCTSAPTPPRDGSWVSKFLKEWDNPVFAPAAEKDIAQVSFEGITLDNPSSLAPAQYHQCSQLNLDKAFSNASSVLSSRLSKADLAQARIISQVDKKFILALMQPSRPKAADRAADQTIAVDDQQILILIDQHAADERIRVENLLADLCTSPCPEAIHHFSTFAFQPAIATALLPKPMVFQIKPQEQALFAAQLQHFANWGILYDLRSPPANAPSSAAIKPQPCNLTIKTLPPVIAERCRQEPKLLINLLRKEIWKRDEGGLDSTLPTQPSSNNDPNAHQDNGSRDWLTLISSCPQGILDMINSRACRSAVMFNDELTKGECEVLVKRLAGCRFPFQCAHGRVSMVPLVALGGGSDGEREVGGIGVDGGNGVFHVGVVGGMVEEDEGEEEHEEKEEEDRFSLGDFAEFGSRDF
ncbi:MAG: hypothetical protein Q9170_004949 [Blastenia crenularia]